MWLSVPSGNRGEYRHRVCRMSLVWTGCEIERMRHVIIGLGSMGQRHLSILRKLRPEDKFVTVDVNGTANYTIIESGLIEGSIVYICTPTRQHYFHLNYFLGYSPRAIFVEKPLFSSEFDYRHRFL